MILKEGCSYLSMSVYLGNKIISIPISNKIANLNFFSKHLNVKLFLQGSFLILVSSEAEGFSSVGPCKGNHNEGCNIIENNMGKRECVCGMGCERWEREEM